MPARLVAAFATVLLLGLVAWSEAPPVRAGADPRQEQLDSGRALFAANCRMCHGDEGGGGRAPSLRGPRFTVPFVRKAAEDGRPGTMMPKFTPRLSATQIEDLAVYVVSLQPHVRDRESAGAGPNRQTDPMVTGDPVAGRLVFFNRSVLDSCHVCHTYDGQGGRVGPNLTSRMSGRSPREIFHRIVVLPHRSVDPDYVRVRITTKAGAKYVGIRAESGNGELHFYDTASLPPVLRAIPKGDVASVVPVAGSPMPTDYATRLSLKQLLDLVAFLKAGSTPVSLADVLDLDTRSGG